MDLDDRLIYFEGKAIKFETWTKEDDTVNLTVEGLTQLYNSMTEILLSRLPSKPKSDLETKPDDIPYITSVSIPKSKFISMGFTPPPPSINPSKGITNSDWNAEQHAEMKKLFTCMNIKSYQTLNAFIVKMEDPTIKTYIDLNGSNVDRLFTYMKKEGLYE